jgi:IMP dehydrogenase/GMP reductase
MTEILIYIKIFSFIVSLVLLCGIVYSIFRFRGIMQKMKKGAREAEAHVPEEKPENLKRWQEIVEKGKSLDENERKFALIEADTMIDKMLSMMGYTGENLGAKLKQVERGDIVSLDDMWEAHKVRNRIAHEADFKLGLDAAEIALLRFEKALKELEYI